MKNNDKFQNLERLCQKAKADGIELILIDNPHVLGDTYQELVANLEMVAEAGLALRIIPSSKRT